MNPKTHKQQSLSVHQAIWHILYSTAHSELQHVQVDMEEV